MQEPATTVIRMPRPPWTPTTNEQRAVIAKLDELAAKVQELWETVDTARRLGVPKDVIARHASGAVSRATVYRRLGKKPGSERGVSSS